MYLKKELYELVRNDESIFDFVHENALDGLWYLDLDNPENLWVNSEFLSVLGFSSEEALQMSISWQQFLNKEEFNFLQENLNKHIESSNALFNHTIRYRHKNGSSVFLHCYGKIISDKKEKPIRVLGANKKLRIAQSEQTLEEPPKDYLKLYEELIKINVELKDAKEKAEKSEERLNSLINTINSGVAFYRVINEGKSGSDFIIQSFNKFALEHENLEEKDVIGKSLKDIRPNIDDFGLIDIFRRVWKTGKPEYFPAKLYLDDKYTNYYENRVFKISSGEIVAVYDDVTIRERSHFELITALEKARESDRLKSAFLANMSHEIRTPMNGILGFADLLKEPDLTSEMQQKYINVIEKSGARMLNIINDIVSISKIESGVIDIRISETNINAHMKFVFDLFKIDADNKKLNLVFNLALPDEEAIVFTDSDKFNSILTNLVKNAIKYTDIGTVEFGYTKREEEFEFFIRDTGIGISDEKCEVIFRSFIQADIEDRRAREGAGLGLAISKAYVEKLGGIIRVESEEGVGSTFYFTIPNSGIS